VPRTRYADLAATAPSEGSGPVRARVLAARAIQAERYRPHASRTNATAPFRDLRPCCALDRDGQRLLEDAMERLGLSARGHDRVLRVARTVADLAGVAAIRSQDLAEALCYRG
jgi:magnesium chelatase family protein